MSLIKKYYHWLHGQWPAAKVERKPFIEENYQSSRQGIYIIGGLSGLPLLKYAVDSGAEVIQKLIKNPKFIKRKQQNNIIDVLIVGSGVAGVAAAIEAQKCGLTFKIIEKSKPLFTIENFPKNKKIMTYPLNFKAKGELQFNERSKTKNGLLNYLKEQLQEYKIHIEIAELENIKEEKNHFQVKLERRITENEDSLLKRIKAREKSGYDIKAHRVIIAIGKAGTFNKLNIEGEHLAKVKRQLIDPADYTKKHVAVIGGGDSALETAIDLAKAQAKVALIYRKAEFSRAKSKNIELINSLKTDRINAGKIKVFFNSTAKSISESHILLEQKASLKSQTKIQKYKNTEYEIKNDNVFLMIGRKSPTEFLKKHKLRVHGELTLKHQLTALLSLIFFFILYHWKKPGVFIPIGDYFQKYQLFPYNIPQLWHDLGEPFSDPTTILGTLKISLGEPGFYYSVLYCFAVVFFGLKRIKYRKTAYIKKQTLSLIFFQLIPLFLIPYIILPNMGNNGLFELGYLKDIADELFPMVTYGHGREYWRAFGFILAWPLFIWNVFTAQPLWGWLIISLLQTFVIIPLLVLKYGKGVYCGFICSCGALAETMGDKQRHKMPHGETSNKFNMIGQLFLFFAFFLLATKIYSWVSPNSKAGALHYFMLKDAAFFSYTWLVDLMFAGVFGVAFYWHFSGRIWCRFACPLAALMNIYARFSKFRIFSNKEKCISCQVCTSVCHQGIDVMSFANKGLPMNDPQCVRCSACINECPTNVLSFGEINLKTGKIIRKDTTNASLVQLKKNQQVKS